MGEAKRRRMAGQDVFLAARDTSNPYSLPQIGAALMVCEIGTRGEMTRESCRATADWIAKAIDTQPGAMMLTTIGGYGDDPRELLDIPEACQAFAWFGQRLREIDDAAGNTRLVDTMDSCSRATMLVAMGLWPRSLVRVRPDNDPALIAQRVADAQRVRAADQAHRATEAAQAGKARKH